MSNQKSSQLKKECELNLASLVCDVGCWLGGRVSALHSVVTGLISSGGDHTIHCW